MAGSPGPCPAVGPRLADAVAVGCIILGGLHLSSEYEVMALRIRPLDASFGAEIIGVDFSCAIDDSTVAEIEAAWHRYSILLFRNVAMTPAQHVAFTRRLGQLHIMEPLEFNLPGFPEVLVVS